MENSKIGIFPSKNEIFPKWLQIWFIGIKWHPMAIES